MAETNDEVKRHVSQVLGCGLIDLGDAPLHELLHREDDTALAQALRKVTAEASRRPEDTVSAFNSSVL